MRRLVELASVLVLIVATVATPIQAAKKAVTASEQYQAWIANSLGERKGAQHYCLSVVARRLDAKSANVDVVVSGPMTGYSLTVRPIRLFGDVREPEGEAMTVGTDATVSNDAVSNVQLQAEINADTNVVEVQLVAGNQSANLTLLIPLNAGGAGGALGFVTPNSGCPQCFTASLTCGGCSTSKECKYCQPNCQANYAGNCSTCTITCSCGKCRLNE